MGALKRFHLWVTGVARTCAGLLIRLLPTTKVDGTEPDHIPAPTELNKGALNGQNGH